MMELDSFEKNNKSPRKTDGFRESLWKSSGKHKETTDSETFLTDFFETFFTGQRRWDRGPSDIKKGK